MGQVHLRGTGENAWCEVSLEHAIDCHWATSGGRWSKVGEETGKPSGKNGWGGGGGHGEQSLFPGREGSVYLLLVEGEVLGAETGEMGGGQVAPSQGHWGKVE